MTNLHQALQNLADDWEAAVRNVAPHDLQQLLEDHPPITQPNEAALTTAIMGRTATDAARKVLALLPGRSGA